MKMIKLGALCKDISLKKVDFKFKCIPLFTKKLERQFERELIIRTHNVFIKEKTNQYKEKDIEMLCCKMSNQRKSKSLNKKSQSSSNVIHINTFPKLLNNKSFSGKLKLKPRTNTVTGYSVKLQSKIKNFKMPPLPINHPIIL